jgi:hypothetical protein
MVDETGDNTNQEKNGHHGGQKFLTIQHGEARERCNTNECHFTFLPFVAAMEDPVMCAVSIAKKGPLAMEDRSGFNAMAQMDEQDELDTRNIDKAICRSGKDNIFPY